MDFSKLVAEIDEQIASLQAARAALLAITPANVTKGKRGRPKGSTNAAKSAKKKHNLSPEGRKRIADAMKRRWAAQRKETAAAAKSTGPKK